jgi:hypothetical protein
MGGQRVIGRTWRAAVVVFSVVLVASCGQLFARESPRDHWSTHTVGELCRYPLDFFTDHLGRPGLEVVSPTGKPDQKIDGFGGCTLDGPNGSLTSLHVSASLELDDDDPPEGLTADYEEREPVQVGADVVQVWSRDDRMGRDLRVDIDGWTGRLVVHLLVIGEPTGDEALPDEHLPAAAEMLVRMTRELKGPSRQPPR